MDTKHFLKNSAYVKRDHIDEAGGELSHDIHDVEEASFKDGKTRPQLVFGDGTRFTVNDTNLRLLQKHFGYETDAWVGKRVILWFDEAVTYQGRLVGGIRLRVPRLPAPTRRPATTIPPTGDASDSEAPF